jgi:hypothetical protein
VQADHDVSADEEEVAGAEALRAAGGERADVAPELADGCHADGAQRRGVPLRSEFASSAPHCRPVSTSTIAFHLNSMGWRKRTQNESDPHAKELRMTRILMYTDISLT